MVSKPFGLGRTPMCCVYCSDTAPYHTRRCAGRLTPTTMVAARDGDIVTANVEVTLEDGTPMDGVFE